MDHGEYVGGRADLRGKRALVRPAEREGYLLAQFDDISLDAGREELEGCLAHGWTEFPVRDFKLLVPVHV